MNEICYERYNEIRSIIEEKLSIYSQFINPNISVSDIKDMTVDQAYSNLDKKVIPKSGRKKTSELQRIEGLSKMLTRSDFAYTKFKKYNNFEISSNFAFEFAKRRYPTYWQDEMNIHIDIVFMDILDKSLGNNMKIYKYNTNPSVYDIIIMNLDNDIYYNKLKKHIHSKNEILSNIDTKSYIKYNGNIMEQKIISPLYYSPFLIESMEHRYLVDLNLAQPEDELIEYIKYIRKQYLNIQTDRKSKLEYFNSTKKSYIDILADVLFIYDCKKLQLSDKLIQKSLLKFYGKKEISEEDKEILKNEGKESENGINKKSLAKYFDYGKLLIEEEYYKEFIFCKNIPLFVDDDKNNIYKLENDEDYNIEILNKDDTEVEFVFHKIENNDKNNKLQAMKNTYEAKKQSLLERKKEIDAKYQKISLTKNKHLLE